jgi:hypothetical protein
MVDLISVVKNLQIKINQFHELIKFVHFQLHLFFFFALPPMCRKPLLTMKKKFRRDLAITFINSHLLS